MHLVGFVIRTWSRIIMCDETCFLNLHLFVDCVGIKYIMTSVFVCASCGTSFSGKFDRI